MSFYTIAIDGPSGAGKSSMADALACRLGILHLDTGAMYRGIACACMARGCDVRELSQVEKLLPELKMEIRFENGKQRTLVNGEDMTPHLYTPQASMGASDVSKHSAVRRKLVALQRELAETQSFILDGRDIGTVVLPDAKVKFYLSAGPEIRARRRFLDLQAAGDPSDYAAVLADIKKRDAQDSGRQDSPLAQAETAYRLDSDRMSKAEVFEKMLQILRDNGIDVPEERA